MAEKVVGQIDQDGNATVMLNRPDVHNAFDPDMVDQLTRMLEKLAADQHVRAIVLMGAGPDFCAGADIAEMKKSARYSAAENVRIARRTARMLQTLYQLRKPTIACVRGAVRGGGIGLIAACDIAVASRTATFRLSEVKLGIMPSMIGPYVMAAIGERMARRYMLTGEEFDVADAYRMGLIHEIVEEEALIPTVGALLARLYSSGPNAIAAVKDMIPQIAHAPIDDALVEETAKRIAALRVTPEAQDGLSAFLEKRKPKWVASQSTSPARKRARKTR